MAFQAAPPIRAPRPAFILLESDMGFLAGKKLLITGVLSNRSIAYGIAKACHREGAELAFTYVGERFADRVAGFAAEFGSDLCLPMDVGSDEEIAAVAAKLSERVRPFDRLRAPRSDRRRLPGRDLARRVPRRDGHLGLLVPGAREGLHAAHEGPQRVDPDAYLHRG